MFLVPYLTKKPLYSVRLANWVWILITVGTALSWIAAFIWQYAPSIHYIGHSRDTKQFSTVGGIVFIIGIAMIMVGTLGIYLYIYARIFQKSRSS